MLHSEIRFINEKLKIKFKQLEKDNKELYMWINNAMNILENNAHAGIHIKKRLIPKNYKQHGITNLWKYNLPKGWRLIYSVAHEEVIVVSIVLEWFDHKNYERRFNY